jgi:hypothetical protein
MPKVVVKNPNAIFVQNSWNPNAGTVISCVTDGVDATYMQPTGAFEDLLYDFEDITDAPSSAVVTSVVTANRVVGPADASLVAKAWILGSVVTGAGIGLPGAWITLNSSWPTITTVGTFNSSKFGVGNANWSVAAPGLADLFVTVIYQMPSGGFAALVASLGPLVALGLGDLARLAAELYRRTGALILPGEYAQVWQELQSARYPRHFDLGRK